MIRTGDLILYFRVTDHNFVVHTAHDHKEDLQALTLEQQGDAMRFMLQNPLALPDWVSPPVLVELMDDSASYRLIVNGSYLLVEDGKDVVSFSLVTGSIFTSDAALTADIQSEGIQEADAVCEKNAEALTAALQPYTGSVRPNGLCVVTTARNEGVYLPHWIDYHRKLGVDHFFIYTNNNTDGSDALLSLLSALPFVTVYDNTVAGSGASPQKRAFTHAFVTGPQPARGYEWCFVMDADEYITLSPAYGGSFKNLLQGIKPDVSSVSLCWQFARPVAVHTTQDLLVPLPDRNPQLMNQKYVGEGYRLVKTLFRTRDVLSSTPHFPIWKQGVTPLCVLSDGLLHEYKHNPQPFSNDPMFTDRLCRVGALIIHYFSKSPAEFFLKTCRSRGFDSYVDGLDTTRLTSPVWVEPFIASVLDDESAQPPLYTVKNTPSTGNFSYVSQFLQNQIEAAHRLCAQKTWENFIAVQNTVRKSHSQDPSVQLFMGLLDQNAQTALNLPEPAPQQPQSEPGPIIPVKHVSAEAQQPPESFHLSVLPEQESKFAQKALTVIEVVSEYGTEYNAAALCGVIERLKEAYQQQPDTTERYILSNATIGEILDGRLKGHSAVASFMQVVNNLPV